MKLFWAWEKTHNTYDDTENTLEVRKWDIWKEEQWQISLDIIENSLEFIIVSPIAWVNLDNIDISLKDDVITISWTRDQPEEIYCVDNILRVDEVFWGKFSRNIILPDNLNLDQIKAILEKNVLIIRIPKLKFKGQKVEIENMDEA